MFSYDYRFSEDIDITFTEHIGEARRKKLKYNILGEISKDLNLPISNWSQIESDKDYNCYVYSYDPLNEFVEESLFTGVKLETALASYAFPTELREVDSYVRQFLQEENTELIEDYGLGVFEMNVQAMERTFVDKVFALCDYYLQGKSKRYSRHLYDIFKLNPYVEKDEKFRMLVKEVKVHRAKMSICPSAKAGISIPILVHAFCDSHFYEKDYMDITGYFTRDYVAYDETIRVICELVDDGYFDE